MENGRQNETSLPYIYFQNFQMFVILCVWPTALKLSPHLHEADWVIDPIANSSGLSYQVSRADVYMERIEWSIRSKTCFSVKHAYVTCINVLNPLDVFT